MTVMDSVSYLHPASKSPSLSSTNDQETTWSLSLFQKFCRSQVLKALNEMRQGHLVLHQEDGITYIFGSPAPEMKTANIYVREPQFFVKVFMSSHVGFGESYCDGDWDTEDLEAVFQWGIANADNSPLLENKQSKHQQVSSINFLGLFNRLIHHFHHNSINNSKNNIQVHYDLSNKFFSLFLDETMTYSAARFYKRDESLEQAQIQKYEALCRKLRLKPGDRLLEIGSGWGGFAIYAAKSYQCEILTITLSKEQYDFTRSKIIAEGLEDKIKIQILDYRHLDPDIHGLFDKVVSIEMIEAVGDAYYENYFRQCEKMLKPSGLLVLQMITCPDSRYELLKRNVDFIQKHIFPGSLIPSLGRLHQATSRVTELSMFELEDIGLDYAKTLGLWHKRFNRNIVAVEALGFDNHFIRKWQYYLLYCKAAFSSRHLSTVQAVYTRSNNLTLRNKGAEPC